MPPRGHRDPLAVIAVSAAPIVLEGRYRLLLGALARFRRSRRGVWALGSASGAFTTPIDWKLWSTGRKIVGPPDSCPSASVTVMTGAYPWPIRKTSVFPMLSGLFDVVMSELKIVPRAPIRSVCAAVFTAF